MKSWVYLDTSTENHFQHSEKMNIHLKCPEVFLPKIDYYPENEIHDPLPTDSGRLTFFPLSGGIPGGAPHHIIFWGYVIVLEGTKSSSPPFLNHQSSKHPGDLTHEPLDRPFNDSQRMGETWTETGGFLNLPRGKGAGYQRKWLRFDWAYAWLDEVHLQLASASWEHLRGKSWEIDVFDDL